MRTQWHWLRIGYPLPSTKDICHFSCLLGVRGLKGHRSQKVINLFVSRSYSTEQTNSMLALSLYAYKTLSTVCLSDVTNYKTICLPPMSLTQKPVYMLNHSSPLTLARSHNLEPITRRFLKQKLSKQSREALHFSPGWPETDRTLPVTHAQT